jgi:hypothetical protein
MIFPVPRANNASDRERKDVAQAVRKKSLATTYSPTHKGQYHRRGRA